MTDRNLLGLLSLEPLQQGADFLKFSDLLLPAFLKLGLLGCVTANQLLDLLALALIRVHKRISTSPPRCSKTGGVTQTMLRVWTLAASSCTCLLRRSISSRAVFSASPRCPLCCASSRFRAPTSASLSWE